jgi:hypothetical protein
MTDDEYNRFLVALAGKHEIGFSPLQGNYNAQQELNRLSQIVRLLKAAQSRPEDTQSTALLREELQTRPLDPVRSLMSQAGLLDAVDDAPAVFFREFRRSAVPPEDYEILKRAGITDDEIEIMLVLAEEEARMCAHPEFRSEKLLQDASDALSQSDLLTNPSKKKRKIFNGIGKILGGAVAGVGNTMIAAGAIVVPAAGAAAIASAGLAITSICGGIGDLRGE